MCILWIWSYPLTKKEFFLKLAVPKKLAKSLKTIWKELHFYCICSSLKNWNFLKHNSFTSISQGFTKTRIPPHCMWNSKKPNNRRFWIFLSSSIYYSSPFMFSNFMSTFFLETPPKKMNKKWKKKWSFPLRISLVNVTKFAKKYGIDHIYWGNISWKTSIFVKCSA